MNTEKRERRARIKRIRTLAEYHAIMDAVMISPEERTIADLVFVHAMSYAQIGDKLGYSERTIKRKMSRILSVL